MTREAKLYILLDKDWKPLAQEVENDPDHALRNDMAVFQLQSAKDSYQYYAVLSLSEKADKLVEDYGAAITHENNYLLLDIKDYQGEPLYGDKSILGFLPEFKQ